MPHLYDRVLAFIADAGSGCFEALALEIFAHQFDGCAPFRRYCLSRGRTPDTVTDWHAIPPVPIVAFKHANLCCGPPVRTFLSSGTTAGPALRSRHCLPDLRLYRASALAAMRQFLLPDLPRGRLVSIVPRVDDLPESSLAQMVDWAVTAFGSGDSTWTIGPSGIDLDGFIAALRASERDGQPLVLLATTGALIRVLDRCRERALTFRLPHGSRLMDTGGDKGSPRHVSRNGLLHAVWQAFAIPGYFCVNEYGMAELSSQFYDSVIADRVRGQHRPRRKLGPHWVRTLVLDPETLAAVESDRPGLLCHIDLANAGSVAAVLSEDLGRQVRDGFELLGRAVDAETRGCSLTTAEWDAA